MSTVDVNARKIITQSPTNLIGNPEKSPKIDENCPNPRIPTAQKTPKVLDLPRIQRYESFTVKVKYIEFTIILDTDSKELSKTANISTNIEET